MTDPDCHLCPSGECPVPDCPHRLPRHDDADPGAAHEHVALPAKCPNDAITCDIEAWERNPRHRWVYDRLLIAGTQGYPHGPAGTSPDAYPVIVKPITNLLGMGRGATIASAPPTEPGMMWAEFLTGRHVSTDMIVDGGAVVWSAQAIGYRAAGSLRFSFWTLLEGAVSPELEVAGLWLQRHLPDYSGPVNVETIGGRIVEVHLRLTADWQSAGLYAPLRPAIGVPLWDVVDLSGLPPWAMLSGDDEAPIRHGFVVVPV